MIWGQICTSPQMTLKPLQQLYHWLCNLFWSVLDDRRCQARSFSPNGLSEVCARLTQEMGGGSWTLITCSQLLLKYQLLVFGGPPAWIPSPCQCMESMRKLQLCSPSPYLHALGRLRSIKLLQALQSFMQWKHLTTEANRYRSRVCSYVFGLATNNSCSFCLGGVLSGWGAVCFLSPLPWLCRLSFSPWFLTLLKCVCNFICTLFALKRLFTSVWYMKVFCICTFHSLKPTVTLIKLLQAFKNYS